MLGYLNITGLDLALLLNLRTHDWDGNAYCAREKLANSTHLIFMAEPYPCYPCNPRHGEQAVVLLRLWKSSHLWRRKDDGFRRSSALVLLRRDR